VADVDRGSLASAGQKKKSGGGGGKLMGLPTYAWVGVIAAGLLLGIYLRSRGGSSSSSSPAVDTSSVPASVGGGGYDTGLSGSSVGGDSSASIDNGLSDLLNALGVQSEDTEALTAQISSLVSLPVGQIASSGGSGAGHSRRKPKANHHKPATSHAKKQHKAEQKKNKRVAAT
jgi:hypothetical protein